MLRSARWASMRDTQALGELVMGLRAGLMAALVFATSNIALAQDAEDVAETIELFRGIPQVAPYFASAYGYAVWPRIGRGGLGIGGAMGRGQVYAGGAVTGSSRLMDITIGAQAGGQAYRQVIFFEDKAAYDKFTGGRFEFDASASAVAVTASAQARASTQGASAAAGAGNPNTGAGVGYVNGMQTFTMAEGGLMYAATIGGQRYNFTAAN
jgi:lipid-binding SYLF domain-containing protein